MGLTLDLLFKRSLGKRGLEASKEVRKERIERDTTCKIEEKMEGKKNDAPAHRYAHENQLAIYCSLTSPWKVILATALER